ncbi:MAG: inorganic diphosphatase [Alphaproteobacteria bacterium]|jgi:inorganic pyrophosphatase|nr:inorganic diphosphatase [Alphaproteobacteria bacterium]
MDINKIPVGNAPEEVNVIIEISAGSAPVKYEFDKDSGALFVDRFLTAAMFYPANYGFIPHTLSEDGDPADVLVISQTPIIPGAVVAARPIGVLLMEDESGLDEKIIAVPKDKLHPFTKEVQSLDDLPEITLKQISHFFERYKDLEEGKWVKVQGYADKKRAFEIINDSVKKAA